LVLDVFCGVRVSARLSAWRSPADRSISFRSPADFHLSRRLPENRHSSINY
jgi:hypothetical protein